MLTELQIEVCKAALKKMQAEGHFSICVVNDILKITGGVPLKEDYEALRLLHCVNFRDMSPRLRMEFPALLKRVLEAPGMELEINYKAVGRPVNLLN
jgi:hypothetical protein